MNELTQQGITALKSGDRAGAHQLFTAALKQNPDDAVAWLWMTGVLNSDSERIQCLRQVLRIDPGNQAALRGLAQIQARQSTTIDPAPAAAEEQAAAAKQPAAEEQPAAVDWAAAEETAPSSGSRRR